MKHQNLLSLTWKNFSQRPYRNGILIICVIAVVGMQMAALLIDRASQKGLELGIKRLGADLVAVPRGLEGKLVRSYMTGKPAIFYMSSLIKIKIQRFDFVEQTSAQLYIKSLTNATCCSAWNVFLIGFEPETDFTIKPWLSQQNKVTIGLDEILVGSAISGVTGTELKFYGHKFKIAGTLAPTNMGLDTSIFIPIKTAYQMAKDSAKKAEKKLDIKSNQISAVLIKLKPEDKGGFPRWKAAYEIEKAIPEISIIQPADIVVKVQKNIADTLKTLNSVSYAIWPITILLIGLVFAMAANERQNEIGLYRAMGATRGFIFRMIVLEAILVAGIGALIGFIVSVGIVSGFSRLIATTLEMPFYLPEGYEITAMLFAAIFLALLTGAVSAMIPALQASLKEPYEAIRQGE